MKNKTLISGLVCLALMSSGSALAATKKTKVKTPVAENDGMVLIPAGEFKMGSDKEENEAMYREANALNPFGFNDRLYVDERPAHKTNLPAYKIDKYEVTNAQYRAYAIDTEVNVPPHWPSNGYNYNDETLAKMPLETLRQLAINGFKLDMDVTAMTQEQILAEMKKVNAQRDHEPVVFVSWFEAGNYCDWAGKRLPTEAEWEKAARGTEGFEYVWGNQWDPRKINTMSENPDAPYNAVGLYPQDVSPYGVYDMTANVAEWVYDWYEAYPGAPKSDIKFFGKKQRVIRGGMTSSGHYDSVSVVFRAAKRTHLLPQTRLVDVGFRCAKGVNK
jgi:formylglycine-generating enzyme required for sulfatase activity